MISTGNARAGARTTNTENASTNYGSNIGDTDLQRVNAKIYNQPLKDEAIFTFDIVPSVTGDIYFTYVFGSEVRSQWLHDSAVWSAGCSAGRRGRSGSHDQHYCAVPAPCRPVLVCLLPHRSTQSMHVSGAVTPKQRLLLFVSDRAP